MVGVRALSSPRSYKLSGFPEKYLAFFCLPNIKAIKKKAMAVVKVYNTSTPTILIPLAAASRTVFRFYTGNPQNNDDQINLNLGIDSAIITIYPENQDPITLDLTRQANADFILFLNPEDLTLAQGLYDYSLFLDGDTVPFVSGTISIGIVLQEDQYIGVLNASRNSIMVNEDILENPRFQNSETVEFTIENGGDGSSIIEANYSGVAGHIIQDEGIDLAQEPYLDFVGAGVDAFDYVGKTIVSIPGQDDYATQEQVDAGSPDNVIVNPVTYQQGITNRIASQVDAETGTNNSEIMTPLRTAQAIEAQVVQGHRIQDHGASLDQQPVIDFTGNGVTATDDSGSEKTIVTISGELPIDILLNSQSGSIIDLDTGSRLNTLIFMDGSGAIELFGAIGGVQGKQLTIKNTYLEGSTITIGGNPPEINNQFINFFSGTITLNIGESATYIYGTVNGQTGWILVSRSQSI